MECQEGGALHAALRQARIPCRYYLATNKGMFESALDYIAKQRHHAPQGIVLHISCHGNEDGIGLTDGGFFAWDELHPVLLNFARQGLAYQEEAKVSSIILCMSTCSGLAARKIGEKQDRPFMTLVAPCQSVLWSDCIASFLTFYNLFLVKNMPCNEAVRGMNAAAGLDDLFHFVNFSDDLKRVVEKMRTDARR